MAVTYTHECDFTKTGMAHVQAWRYDYGQRLELIGDNIDETFVCQWAYNGITSVTSVAITKETVALVDHYYSAIPDAALEQADAVKCYVCSLGASIGNTAYYIEIAIRDRLPSA